MSEQGWGEFPIQIEIFPKKGHPTKLSHYLKLNAPERIVVNESYEHLEVAQSVTLSELPHLLANSDETVMSEYFSTHMAIDYTSLEESFLAANEELRDALISIVHDLGQRALSKAEEAVIIQEHNLDR